MILRNLNCDPPPRYRTGASALYNTLNYTADMPFPKVRAAILQILDATPPCLSRPVR